jgi:hypothetical protein
MILQIATSPERVIQGSWLRGPGVRIIRRPRRWMAYKRPIRRLAQGPLARQPSYGCPARRFARDSAAHAMTEYTPASASPPTLMAQVRDAIRLRHYSQRTEHAYASWIRDRRATLGRHRQAGNVRFLAAFIRNPSFGCGLRHPHHSAIARPSRRQHDDDPHARPQPRRLRRAKPTRSTVAALASVRQICSDARSQRSGYRDQPIPMRRIHSQDKKLFSFDGFWVRSVGESRRNTLRANHRYRNL